MRYLGIGLVVLTGLIAWQLVDGERLEASAGGNSRCSIAGTWLDVFQDGTKILYTFTPLEPSGRRVAMVGSPVIGATVGGLFPDAVGSTEFRGVAERGRHGAWSFTIRRYVMDAAGTELYEQVASGVARLTDCDTISAVYSNEFITPDGETALCVPGTSPEVVRLGIDEPCADL